jgi:fluoroquinolone transport system ATP-binding protein
VSFIVDGRISLTESPRKLKIERGRRSVRIEYGDDGAGRRSADFPLEGIGANAVFLDLLRNRRIETIHTLEASLEEIFLQVTGRSLT